MGSNVYFSIGDAIAGLGIFLLIPQYLKPIYVFRLRVLGIGLRLLYALPGVGFLCVVAAALVPYVPESAPVLLRTPLSWELIGGFLYAISYSALAWVYIFPARPGPRSIAKYVRAGTNLLASASDEDRVELAADILANIKTLIRIADAQGAETQADKNVSDAAAYSESFLRILSDPVFCRTVVSRVPWDAARILRAFSEEHPTAQVGRDFVHQITRQSLIASATGARQIDWSSFSDAPPLAKAAFGDAFLNRYYLPWEGIAASDFDEIDAALMERVYEAARLTVDEHIADGFSVQSYNVARLQETFEVIGRRIAVLKKTDADISRVAETLGQAVKHIVEATRNYLASAAPETRQGLYADEIAVRDFSTIDSIAEVVISVLENAAQEFAGYDDKLWRMAREIWDSVLPRFGVQPAGMDPLQQRFTLKLIEKMKESLEGLYSPLSRQALAIIGPYSAKGESKERTGFKICRDLVYLELKAFPAYFEADVERASALLPDNVRYEAETTTLIHRYSFGGEDRTSLALLEIPAVSLDRETVGMSRRDAGTAPAVAASP
jgi:hypothetical protein